MTLTRSTCSSKSRCTRCRVRGTEGGWTLRNATASPSGVARIQTSVGSDAGSPFSGWTLRKSVMCRAPAHSSGSIRPSISTATAGVASKHPASQRSLQSDIVPNPCALSLGCEQALAGCIVGARAVHNDRNIVGDTARSQRRVGEIEDTKLRMAQSLGPELRNIELALAPEASEQRTVPGKCTRECQQFGRARVTCSLCAELCDC